MDRYEQAIVWLEALSSEPLVRTAGAAPQRLTFLLEALDLSWHQPVVHVVGTCGKGSTATFIAAGLQAAGHRTGLFTGPHLMDYGERMVVNGQPISRPDLHQALQHLELAVERLRQHPLGRPTVLEVLTAAALWSFAPRVDVLVLEAGLGGARDCTMAVPATVTVLTRLGLDHQDIIGPLLSDIIREKASAIRPGVPMVLAPQNPEAHEALRSRATVDVQAEVQPTLLRCGLDGVTFDSRHGRFELSMLGRHQMDNAATALAALHVLRPRCPVTDEQLRDGLRRAQLAGRLQRVGRNCLVDGAHNVDGARALSDFLRDVGPPRPLHMVVGVLADKNREAILDTLLPWGDAVHATLPKTLRSGSPEIWEHMVRARRADARLHPDVQTALMASQADDPALVVVAGSLYLAGEALEALLKRPLRRAPCG